MSFLLSGFPFSTECTFYLLSSFSLCCPTSPLLSVFSLDIFFSCLQLAVVPSKYNFCLVIRLSVRLSSSALTVLSRRNRAPVPTAGSEEEEKAGWAVHDQHVLRGLALECLVGCQWSVKRCASDPEISSYKYLYRTHTRTFCLGWTRVPKYEDLMWRLSSLNNRNKSTRSTKPV